MLWYQRSLGATALKLIGYLYYQAVTMEESYGKHFNITGDFGGNAAKNGSLTVQITIIYYCATSYALSLVYLFFIQKLTLITIYGFR